MIKTETRIRTADIMIRIALHLLS